MSSATDGVPFHGLLGKASWPSPIKTLHCDQEARPGYRSVKAHEFNEHEHVFTEKIKLLVKMICANEKFIAYTGAGISTSSGIGDYASRSAGKQSAISAFGAVSNSYSAKPSLAHRCLVNLYRKGLLKWWCQQNHDGLPQKAGLPQCAINEIHGSWWDPTNPVVAMSGELRGDLFEDLLKWEGEADLCLAVGTSLSGMNADRLVESCGTRFMSKAKRRSSFGKELLGGSVIVGFQCTSLDSIASLRIYAPIDKVMSALWTEMKLDETEAIFTGWNLMQEKILQDATIPPVSFTSLPTSGSTSIGVGGVLSDVYYINGYDPSTGVKVLPSLRNITTITNTTTSSGSTASKTDAVTGTNISGSSIGRHSVMTARLDLRAGQKVILTAGSLKGSIGEVMGRSNDNYSYDILFQVPRALTRQGKKQQAKAAAAGQQNTTGRTVGQMEFVPWRTRIGIWMIIDAIQGKAAFLPICSVPS